MSRALLDVSNAFEFGQCYVALSRVTSLEGLWLERPARIGNVKVSPQVVEFFEREENYYEDEGRREEAGVGGRISTGGGYEDGGGFVVDREKQVKLRLPQGLRETSDGSIWPV